MGLLNIFKKGQKGEDDPKLVKKPEQGRQQLDEKPSKKAAKPIAKKPAEKKVASKPVQPKSSGKSEKQAYRVLIKPVVTEKSAYLGSFGQYIFSVAPESNKIMIKKTIQEMYGVTPKKINIINISGRKVRYGRNQGVTKSWKKAIITLKPGDKIDVYEGV